MAQFVLDPDSVLDFAFDWSARLESGETITAATVTADAGVTVRPNPTINGGLVTYWLSGGVLDTTPGVTCHITTSAGRQDDKTVYVDIRER